MERIRVLKSLDTEQRGRREGMVMKEQMWWRISFGRCRTFMADVMVQGKRY
jgi:hypothetical protein